MSDDELYMRRCIALARRAGGYNQPNPQVGALLVHQGRIIGEGWHRKYGEAHAEVNAAADVDLKYAHLVAASTLYVTLEPCFHQGKTPPCVDLVLRLGIRRVVIGSRDPFPLVAGQSITRLKAAGVQVQLMPADTELGAEIARLNRRFFTNVLRARPYIILKYAASQDGFLGYAGETTPISNGLSQRLSHFWRSHEQAILVGTKTAEVDNPRLNNRHHNHNNQGRQPLRLVIDKDLSLPKTLHLFDQTQQTWVFVAAQTPRPDDSQNLRYVPIIAQNKMAAKADFLKNLLDYLHSQKIQSLIVEGGADLLNAFIDADLYDEVRRFTAKNLYLNNNNNKPLIAAPQLALGAPARSFALGDDQVDIFFSPANVIFSQA